MLAGCDLLFPGPGGGPDDGLVRAVAPAPITPDGDVAGRATDVVLDLAVPMDPSAPGLPIRAGDEIRVTLPTAFEKTADLPLLDILTCIDAGLACDSVVPLQGWPQSPLGAPAPFGYDLRYDGPRTLVITATEDLLPAPPAAPGLKQIHLLLNSFINPRPGRYPIDVEVVTATETRRGVGHVQVRPAVRPSVHLTTAMVGFQNTLYQTAAPDSLAPLPLDLLLWDGDGAPLDGVTIDGARLVRGGDVVGRVAIDAPPGAAGHTVFLEAPSERIAAPVSGVPAAHLRAFVRAGSAPGAYAITVTLAGGGSVQAFINVP